MPRLFWPLLKQQGQFITCLKLAGCPKILIDELGLTCPKLQIADITCDAIAMKNFGIPFGTTFRNLKKLILLNKRRQAQTLHDSQLYALFSASPLETMVLRGLDISKAGLMQLIQGLTHVKDINISKSALITNDQIGELKQWIVQNDWDLTLSTWYERSGEEDYPGLYCHL